MSMNFRPGERVAYIGETGDDAGRKVPPVNAPIKGGVYTVRGYVPESCGLSSSALLLVELVNAPSPDGEPTFFDGRFRRVVVKKTDISVFTSMLTDVKQTETA